MTSLTETSLYAAKDMDAKIAAFHKRGQSLQQEAHKLACSALLHVGKNNDVRVVGKLINAMPEMGRANALRGWFEAFGPIAFGEGDSISYVKGGKVKLGEAMKTPFWKFAPEPPYVALDMAKWFDQQVKRLEKDAEETGVDHSAIIGGLRKLQAQTPDKPAKAAKRGARKDQPKVKPQPAKPEQQPAAH